jgi:hypothetical protein
MKKPDDRQLEIPLQPRLKVIDGLGQKKKAEALTNRDAVARVLIGAGADLLLRRISPARAEAIEAAVEEVLQLFDLAERDKSRFAELAHKLNDLEALVRESAEKRPARRHL